MSLKRKREETEILEEEEPPLKKIKTEDSKKNAVEKYVEIMNEKRKKMAITISQEIIEKLDEIIEKASCKLKRRISLYWSFKNSCEERRVVFDDFCLRNMIIDELEKCDKLSGFTLKWFVSWRKNSILIETKDDLVSKQDVTHYRLTAYVGSKFILNKY